MSIENKILNPQMVVLARESRGISQSALSEMLGLSNSKMSFVELNQQTLSSDQIDRLAKALRYPVDFFYQEGESFLPVSLNYRKREHVSAKVLVPLEANLNIFRLNIEKISKKIPLPEINVPEIELKSISDIEELTKKVRKHMKIIAGPIQNLTELLEAHGIIVISFDFGTERVDSKTIHSKSKHPILAINKLLLADRQRFSLAYQLGHLVMHTRNVPSHDRDIAHEANLFAAAFLMPANEMKKEFEKGITIPLLAELKRKWKVSMIALLYRAADLGFLTDNQKKYLLAQFNQLKIRRREPVDLDFPKEKPRLLHSLILKYKNAHKFSAKELAASLCLEIEEFTSKYTE